MANFFFDAILPIFSIGALGYLLGRKGSFNFSMAMTINKFVMLVAVPALIITFMADAPIRKFNFDILGAYFLTEFVLYVAAVLIARVIFNLEIKEAFLVGTTIALTNHILFVLPIAEQLYGQAAVVPVVSIIVMDGILLFSISIIMMDVLSSSDQTWEKTLRKIFSNPPLIAIVFGLVIGLLEFKLPIGLDLFLTSLGGTASPALLFSLGVILSQNQIRFNEPIVWVMIVIKLVAHPIFAFYLFTKLVNISPDDLNPAMLVAAAPCGVMGLMLAINYKVRTELIALAILYTSIGSLMTLTVAAAL